MQRLIPDIVVLRLPAAKGSALRSACLRVSARASSTDAATLLRASATGVFGTRELSLLQRLLDGSAGPSVREMVLLAEEEGLSPEALLALREARAAAETAAASRRRALEARAAEREYQALLRRDGNGGSGGGSGGLDNPPVRAVASQASIGGGLFLVLLSATLMGYFLGIQLYGAGSTGAWVCALISAVGTLLLEGALMVLRMSRADAMERSEKASREAARRRVVVAGVDPLLGCEGGVVAGEFDADKEKAD